jgi:hypothetical protein
MKNSSFINRLETLNRIIPKRDPAIVCSAERLTSEIEQYNKEMGTEITLQNFIDWGNLVHKDISKLPNDDLVHLSELLKRIYKPKNSGDLL